MHEIITLQLGQRSNYLATHFWNTQESYFTYSGDQESIVDHDIHFRPGIGADGAETFTPRTLIYDLKGGFGSLKRINALYEIDEPVLPQGLWNGPAVVQRQVAIEQSSYQMSLEEGVEPPPLTKDSVRYWSDFNRVYFHPKSIVQLNEYELSSKLMPFENWNVGEDLFNSLDKEHDLLDRDLRPFAEEADHMQGIQVITSVDDAWGGFAARYMDRIRDEYGKTAVTVWGLEDVLTTIPREKRFMKLSNTAKSIAEISPQASLFVPISLPAALPKYVVIDPKSHWHLSALFATALESMTLPSRLKLHDGTRETIDQLTSALNINANQNIGRLRMSIDQVKKVNGYENSKDGAPHSQAGDVRAPVHERRSGNSVTTENDEEPQNLDMDFFPVGEAEQARGRRTTKKSHIFGQAEYQRTEEKKPHDNQASELDEGYERSRRRAAGLPIINRKTTPLAFPLLNSFPHIFADVGDTSVNVSTSLSTDTSVALRIKYLQLAVGRAVSFDEREALSNTLGELAEAYEDGWDSGSDDDDD